MLEVQPLGHVDLDLLVAAPVHDLRVRFGDGRLLAAGLFGAGRVLAHVDGCYLIGGQLLVELRGQAAQDLVVVLLQFVSADGALLVGRLRHIIPVIHVGGALAECACNSFLRSDAC